MRRDAESVADGLSAGEGVLVMSAYSVSTLASGDPLAVRFVPNPRREIARDAEASRREAGTQLSRYGSPLAPSSNRSSRPVAGGARRPAVILRSERDTGRWIFTFTFDAQVLDDETRHGTRHGAGAVGAGRRSDQRPDAACSYLRTASGANTAMTITTQPSE